MIALKEVTRLTGIRVEGVNRLINGGVIPASKSESENEPVLTLRTLAVLQDLRTRCIREMAKAFDRPTAGMFHIIKSNGYIFDVEDNRVVLGEESEAHLVQELLRVGKKGGEI